jgi:hypothetical protein
MIIFLSGFGRRMFFMVRLCIALFFVGRLISSGNV